MSVKFFRLDPQKIEQNIRAYARQLTEDPSVLAVVLFGSLARGEATAMSDADLLILLRESSQPFHERIPGFLRPGVSVCLDVFPYTLSEAIQALQERGGLVAVALREGIWLVDKEGVKEELMAMLSSEEATNPPGRGHAGPAGGPRRAGDRSIGG